MGVSLTQAGTGSMQVQIGRQAKIHKSDTPLPPEAYSLKYKQSQELRGRGRELLRAGAAPAGGDRVPAGGADKERSE